MLENVKLGKKKLEDYQKLIAPELYQEIRELSRELSGLRVVHVNATSYGGGVADMLQSFVPLLCDVGLHASWQVIAGTEEFFNVTKFLHNSFQSGEEFTLSKRQKELYEKVNFENAQNFEGNYDIVFIHDPQPAALPYYLEDKKAKKIWRLHIDTSECHPENWSYFAPFLAEYEACVFSSEKYSSETIPIEKKYYLAPVIDPLHPKNLEIGRNVALDAIEAYGIDINRPIVTQASRFDPWKDPEGVIKAYKIAKKKVQGLQLVLVGAMANDDPEGWKIFKELKKMAKGDKDIHLIINTTERNDLTYNSLQRQSDIIVQKSTKEGFGLVVTEAMWKEKAVIGGDTVGIAMQIHDGENGFLVKSVEECADRIVYLYEHQKEAKIMGRRAKASVREKYLLPRLVRDELAIYKELVTKEKTSSKKVVKVT